MTLISNLVMYSLDVCSDSAFVMSDESTLRTVVSNAEVLRIEMLPQMIFGFESLVALCAYVHNMS